MSEQTLTELDEFNTSPGKLIEEDLLKMISSFKNDMEEMKRSKAKVKKVKVKVRKSAKVKKVKKVKTAKIKSVKIEKPADEEKMLERDVVRIPQFKVDKTPGRARFTHNQWVDDGKLCKIDKKHNEKYGKKFIPQERGERPAARMIRMKCSRCNKESDIMSSQLSSDDYYVCTGCCTR